MGLLVLFLMTMQHSTELGRLEERTRTLADELALLRLHMEVAVPPTLVPTDDVRDPEHQRE